MAIPPQLPPPPIGGDLPKVEAAPSPVLEPPPVQVVPEMSAGTLPVTQGSEEMEPIELPMRRRWIGWVLGSVAIAVVAGVVLVFKPFGKPHHSTPPVMVAKAPNESPAPPPTTEPSPTPTVTTKTSASDAPVAATASAATPVATTGTGILKTVGAPPARRIFVDRRTVGQTPAAVTVPCGTHVVQLGSSGRPRTIDVPCGGEIDIVER